MVRANKMKDLVVARYNLTLLVLRAAHYDRDQHPHAQWIWTHLSGPRLDRDLEFRNRDLLIYENRCDDMTEARAMYSGKR